MAGWTAPRRIFLALQVLSLQGKPAILTHHTYAGLRLFTLCASNPENSHGIIIIQPWRKSNSS